MADLPARIQAQVEAADALLAQANAPQEPPQEDPATQQEPPSPEPVQAQTPPPPVAQPPADDPNSETWAARYKTLQGLYNKQVPDLQRQVTDLATRHQQAMERLDKVSEQQAKGSQAEAVKQAADPRDVENFGSDLVEMVQRVVGASNKDLVQRLEGVLSAFDKRLAQVETGLTGASQKVATAAEESFFARLEKAVPAWEAINHEAGFLTWLAETDPISGVARQMMLTQAQESLNVSRVAAIFNAYTQTKPATTTRPQSRLEKQVSPSSAASAQPTSTEKQVYSQKDAAATLNRIGRGMYSEAEATRLEADINLAMAEGRIR